MASCSPGTAWRGIDAILTARQRPPTGRPFQRGQSGNPQGKAPGTPNRATREVWDLARRLVEDPEYQAALRARLLKGQAGALEPLLWHYAYGKPKESVESTTGDPVVIRHAAGRLAGRAARAARASQEAETRGERLES